MQKLLDYIVSAIAGDYKYEIVKSDDADRVIFTIKADPDLVGIIIGKGGKTIRSIRKIVSTKATLDKKFVSVAVEPNN